MGIPSLRYLAASKIIGTPSLFSKIEKETKDSTIIDMDSRIFVLFTKYQENITDYFSNEHFNNNDFLDLLFLKHPMDKTEKQSLQQPIPKRDTVSEVANTEKKRGIFDSTPSGMQKTDDIPF